MKLISLFLTLAALPSIYSSKRNVASYKSISSLSVLSISDQITDQSSDPILGEAAVTQTLTQTVDPSNIQPLQTTNVQPADTPTATETSSISKFNSKFKALKPRLISSIFLIAFPPVYYKLAVKMGNGPLGLYVLFVALQIKAVHEVSGGGEAKWGRDAGIL